MRHSFDSSLDLSLSDLSSLSAFFWVLLFRVTRKYLAHRVTTTNPTWVRRPKKSDVLSGLTVSSVGSDLLDELEVIKNNWGNTACNAECRISLADSRNLPLDNESVNAIITSPPYCTRIDYAITTSIELAVMGHKDIAGLRAKLLGATVANRSEPGQIFGSKANEIIERIRTHPSKASGTYYYHTVLNYFSGLCQSMKEVARVLATSGKAAIVVQNSNYKEIPINLQDIVSEISSYVGLRVEYKVDFPITQSKRQIHKYMCDSARATRPTETVLVLSKRLETMT